MDTLIYPTHCEIVVDSPDNNDDIRELAKICREWIFNKQIVLLRRQNTDSNYFAKLCHSVARDGIYNWRQCSWSRVVLVSFWTVSQADDVDHGQLNCMHASDCFPMGSVTMCMYPVTVLSDGR